MTINDLQHIYYERASVIVGGDWVYYTIIDYASDNSNSASIIFLPPGSEEDMLDPFYRWLITYSTVIGNKCSLN